MDAADHTGARKAAGDVDAAAGNGVQAVRYIITRPCLAEGSLRLLKYLQPLFPAEGQVALQDSKGEQFWATVDPVQGRLMGLGELYRAHNLGVNDVLLISPAGAGPYLIECVVKPHARTPAAIPDRPAPPAPVTEKRVVVHATPHVREVRMERVTTEAPRNEAPGNAAEVRPADTGSRATDTAPGTAQAVVVQASTIKPSTMQQPRSVQQPGTVQQSGAVQAATTGQVQTPSVQPVSSGSAIQHGRHAAPITSITARMQQHPAPPIRLAPALNTPIQMSFPSPASVSGRDAPLQPHSSEAGRRPPTVQARGTSTPQGERQGGAVRPGPTELRHGGLPAAQDGEMVAVVRPAPATPGSPEDHSEAAPHLQNPEDQLATLARLTGYACEHLGSGVVRLRAELGTHSYSVLIATTPQALTTHAWSESCDYMALLTPEDQRPQGIPRFTYAALEALLDNARLAPLTPIDLRGYWNTGSFDQESVESVGELVSAHLGQRGSFSQVLLTLAQQPAHSLVSLPRLAERLGNGVNATELQSILETLSRPPFMALSPMPGGQYYLRSDVRDLLDEFGAYAGGLRRRLRPTPLTATAK